MSRPEVAYLHLDVTKDTTYLDLIEGLENERKTGSLLLLHQSNLSKRSIRHFFSTFSSLPSLYRLPADGTNSGKRREDQPPIGPFEGCVPLWRVDVGFGLI
jgi:hypothetical protein